MKNDNKPTDASFSFEEYRFTRASVNFAVIPETANLMIDFQPAGVYDPVKGLFRMELEFRATDKDSGNTVISVGCEAIFKFRKPLAFDELPSYFFANSTAIIYPYIRAFVSTLTLQANYTPFVLPTYNVMDLGIKLKENSRTGDVTGEIG